MLNAQKICTTVISKWRYFVENRRNMLKKETIFTLRGTQPKFVSWLAMER